MNFIVKSMCEISENVKMLDVKIHPFDRTLKLKNDDKIIRGRLFVLKIAKQQKRKVREVEVMRKKERETVQKEGEGEVNF